MFMPISEKCNKKVASCELDDCFESSFIFSFINSVQQSSISINTSNILRAETVLLSLNIT